MCLCARIIRVSIFPDGAFEVIHVLNTYADLEIGAVGTNDEEEKQAGESKKKGDNGRGTEGRREGTDEMGHKSEERRRWGLKTNEAKGSGEDVGRDMSGGGQTRREIARTQT